MRGQATLGGNWRVIHVLALALRFGVGGTGGLMAAAALVGARVTACLIVGTVALAVLASPPAAAEPETRILILNATDPYLPAYQMIDAAMRDDACQRYDATLRILFRDTRCAAL